MKKLLTLVVIAALVGVAAPYACGQYLQSQNERVLADFNGRYPFYRIEATEQHVGIWKSRYAYTFKFSGPGTTGSDFIAYQVPSYEVHHGPIPFTAIGTDAPFRPALATFALSYDFADMLQTMQLASTAGAAMAADGEKIAPAEPIDPALLAQLPTMTGRGHVGFTGNIEADLGWPAGKLAHNEIAAEWEAAEFSMQGAYDMSWSKLSGGWPKLQVESLEGSLLAEGLNISGTSKAQQSFPTLPEMDAELNIKQLSLTETETGETLLMKNLGYSVDTEYQNDLLDMQIHYGVDELSAKDFNFDTMALDISLDNIEPAAAENLYKHYMEAVMAMMQSADASGSIAGSEPGSFENMLPAFKQLLANHPKLNVSLDVNGELQGEQHFIDANLQADVDAITEDQLGIISSFSMLPFIAPLANAEIDLELAEATLQAIAKQAAAQQVAQMAAAAEENGQAAPSAAEQAQLVAAISGQMISQFIQAGMLIQDGKRYKTKLSYQNGQPLVNGKPMPF